MELGCDGVLINTAIAKAKDPFKMAKAMKYAVISGRLSYLSGRICKQELSPQWSSRGDVASGDPTARLSHKHDTPNPGRASPYSYQAGHRVAHRGVCFAVGSEKGGP